jgi:hypothetical protein
VHCTVVARIVVVLPLGLVPPVTGATVVVTTGGTVVGGLVTGLGLVVVADAHGALHSLGQEVTSMGSEHVRRTHSAAS